MPRPRRDPPAASSRNWPDGPCVDPAAEKIRLLALAVTEAMASRSLRTVADLAEIDHSSLSDLLSGRSWPDSSTIARLEIGLNRALWPPHESPHP